MTTDKQAPGTQPPACGKISEELLDAALRELQHDTGPQDVEYQHQRASLGKAFAKILSHRHPAPVADERAEVGRTRDFLMHRKIWGCVEKGKTDCNCYVCVKFVAAIACFDRLAALSAQPSGALEPRPAEVQQPVGNVSAVCPGCGCTKVCECPVDAPPPSSSPSATADATSSVAIATLRAALEKYGEHHGDCSRWVEDAHDMYASPSYDETQPCTCGFDAALAGHALDGMNGKHAVCGISALLKDADTLIEEWTGILQANDLRNSAIDGDAWRVRFAALAKAKP